MAKMLFLAMGSNFQATYKTLSSKINVIKVLEHEKPNGEVHFAIGGDQGAVGSPRVPVLGHPTMQIIDDFTKKISKDCIICDHLTLWRP